MANPLNGCTIVLTRDAAGLAALATPLMARGAKLVQLPAVVIAALPASAASDALLARVSDAAWLACTSGHGARAFAALWDRLARPWPTTVRLAAVGPSTAAIMTALLGPVDLVPQPHRASALAAALSGRQRGGAVSCGLAATLRRLISPSSCALLPSRWLKPWSIAPAPPRRLRPPGTCHRRWI